MSNDGSMFANKINKKIDNNRQYYYSKNSDVTLTNTKGKNIKQKINEIFTSRNYVYKADVVIFTKSGELRKRIIGKNSNYLITDNNELIPITDILDIKYQ